MSTGVCKEHLTYNCQLCSGIRKEPRRIVQIAMSQEPETYCPIFNALCNDGTLWTLIAARRGPYKWEQVPEIPQ